MHSEFAGEVRFVVENNGVERIDTGFNKNLILDQGLHFFGGGAGSNIMAYCLVGAGNSQPTTTQTQLDACVFGVSGVNNSSKYDHVDDGSNTYKCSLTKSYVFTTLAGQNISEVGLASQYASPSSNYLCTRALIKDVNGNPTVLSLIEGDTLTIYYRLSVVHSTLDANQVINMSDGYDGNEPYNVKIRLLAVGEPKWASYLGIAPSFYYLGDLRVYAGEIRNIGDYSLLNPLGNVSTVIQRPYANDFTKIIDLKFNTSSGNGAIRSFANLPSEDHIFGFHQIRFGRVSDDAPIAKDNTKELTIPIKFTWGRYEGVL